MTQWIEKLIDTPLQQWSLLDMAIVLAAVALVYFVAEWMFKRR